MACVSLVPNGSARNLWWSIGSVTLLSVQMLAVIQHHKFVAVCGPSCSGKTSAIQTAVETLRQIPSHSSSRPGHITCTTIAVEAMREEQLLGFHTEKDGLVSQNICMYIFIAEYCYPTLPHPRISNSRWAII